MSLEPVVKMFHGFCAGMCSIVEELVLKDLLILDYQKFVADPVFIFGTESSHVVITNISFLVMWFNNNWKGEGVCPVECGSVINTICIHPTALLLHRIN